MSMHLLCTCYALAMHFPLTCRNKVTSQLSAGPYYYIARQINERLGTIIIENKLLRFHIAKKKS